MIFIKDANNFEDENYFECEHFSSQGDFDLISNAQSSQFNDNFEDEQDLMLESLEFEASPELTIEESFNELIEEANFRKGV